jgi:hypothetical protein
MLRPPIPTTTRLLLPSTTTAGTSTTSTTSSTTSTTTVKLRLSRWRMTSLSRWRMTSFVLGSKPLQVKIYYQTGIEPVADDAICTQTMGSSGSTSQTPPKWGQGGMLQETTSTTTSTTTIKLGLSRWRMTSFVLRSKPSQVKVSMRRGSLPLQKRGSSGNTGIKTIPSQSQSETGLPATSDGHTAGSQHLCRGGVRVRTTVFQRTSTTAASTRSVPTTSTLLLLDPLFRLLLDYYYLVPLLLVLVLLLVLLVVLLVRLLSNWD